MEIFYLFYLFFTHNNVQYQSHQKTSKLDIKIMKEHMELCGKQKSVKQTRMFYILDSSK